MLCDYKSDLRCASPSAHESGIFCLLFFRRLFASSLLTKSRSPKASEATHEAVGPTVLEKRATQVLIYAYQSGEVWFIGTPIEQAIRRKMQTIGTPLKKWDGKINSGIKTGHNLAFVIDDTTKQALIDESSKYAEIIKPMFRGRDIRRYQANWAKLWLIDTHNGYDDGDDVPTVNIDDYPAIKNHLDKFYSQLEKRYDKGKTPYNLRNCAYHEDFQKEKLVWAELCSSGNAFSYDTNGSFVLNTAYIMTGISLRYLLAILNSNTILFYLDLTNQKPWRERLALAQQVCGTSSHPKNP